MSFKRNVKKVFKSKTINFNAVAGVLALVEANSGILSTVLPGDVYATILAVTTVGNLVLRFFTTKPLAEK